RQVGRAHGVSSSSRDGAGKDSRKDGQTAQKANPTDSRKDGQTEPNGGMGKLPDDDTMALRFGRERLKGRALWVPTWGRWMTWTGHRWEPDEKMAVMSAARSWQRKTLAPELEAKYRPKAKAAATSVMLERMARSNPGGSEKADVWDSQPWLMNTPAGTV